MSQVTWSGSLAIRRRPEGSHKQWVTTEMLAVTVTPENSDTSTTVRIAPGLFTDGASVGRILWTLIGCPFRGKYTPGAFIHDGLYAAHVTTRKEADEIFRLIMIHSGVAHWRAKAMYLAVRIGGKRSWDKHDTEENKRVAKIVTCVRYEETLSNV